MLFPPFLAGSGQDLGDQKPGLCQLRLSVSQMLLVEPGILRTGDQHQVVNVTVLCVPVLEGHAHALRDRAVVLFPGGSMDVFPLVRLADLPGHVAVSRLHDSPDRQMVVRDVALAETRFPGPCLGFLRHDFIPSLALVFRNVPHFKASIEAAGKIVVLLISFHVRVGHHRSELIAEHLIELLVSAIFVIGLDKIPDLLRVLRRVSIEFPSAWNMVIAGVGVHPACGHRRIGPFFCKCLGRICVMMPGDVSIKPCPLLCGVSSTHRGSPQEAE